MTKTLTLKLDARETISGLQIDALALAVGGLQWDEALEMNHPYIYEAMSGVFEAINHEENLIELLNDYGECRGWLSEVEKELGMPDVFRYDLSPLGPFIEYLALSRRGDTRLLFGAWYALNREREFSKLLSHFTDYMRELSGENFGDYSAMPPAYKETLSHAFENEEDLAFDEYLHGDRSGGGLLYEGVKFLFGKTRNAKISYPQKSDTLTLEVTEDTLRQYLIDEEPASSLSDWDEATQKWETQELPDDATLEKMFSDKLNESITYELKKREEHRKQRQAEREERKEYEAKKQEARRAKLEAMTK